MTKWQIPELHDVEHGKCRFCGATTRLQQACSNMEQCRDKDLCLERMC